MYVLSSPSLLRSDDFPGIPPDYEVVIFGPYLEPMYKTKSKHDDALDQLEKLLVSGNPESPLFVFIFVPSFFCMRDRLRC